MDLNLIEVKNNGKIINLDIDVEYLYFLKNGIGSLLSGFDFSNVCNDDYIQFVGSFISNTSEILRQVWEKQCIEIFHLNQPNEELKSDLTIKENDIKLLEIDVNHYKSMYEYARKDSDFYKKMYMKKLKKESKKQTTNAPDANQNNQFSKQANLSTVRLNKVNQIVNS